MSPFPSQLTSIINHLKKLPGVGRKTAERFAFCILEWQDRDLKKFAAELAKLQDEVVPCKECGALTDGQTCDFCEKSRDHSILCIVSSARDIYAIEETKAFKGLYHVLGGLLSPLDGRAKLPLEKLAERVKALETIEVIIALDSTLEGDTTALYIKQKLEEIGVKTTRLAFGLPMGSSLDFVDYGTLEKAFTGRQSF